MWSFKNDTMDHELAKNVSQTKISSMDLLLRTVYHTNHSKSCKSTYGIELLSGSVSEVDWVSSLKTVAEKSIP